MAFSFCADNRKGLADLPRFGGGYSHRHADERFQSWHVPGFVGGFFLFVVRTGINLLGGLFLGGVTLVITVPTVGTIVKVFTAGGPGSLLVKRVRNVGRRRGRQGIGRPRIHQAKDFLGGDDPERVVMAEGIPVARQPRTPPGDPSFPAQ